MPDGGAGEVEAADHVLELRGLAARDRDAGCLRAGAQANGNGIENVRLDLLDGDVVHHRHGPCAHADDVVDVHGDAIDADGIVLAQHGCDHRLGADAVGGDRDALAGDVDDIGEIADVELDAAEAPARRPGGRNPPGQLLRPASASSVSTPESR